MWLATGGRSGVNDRVDILKNRKILVFADWLTRLKKDTLLRLFAREEEK